MEQATEVKRGRPPFPFPSTDEIVRLIRDNKYRHLTTMCREQGWADSTLSECLRDRGDRDYVNEILRGNQHEERLRRLNERDDSQEGVVVPHRRPSDAYEAPVPEGYASDTLEEEVDRFKDLLKVERSRNTSLALKIRKLEAKLYDREELHTTLFELAADIIGEQPKSRIITKHIPRSTAGDDWYCLAPIADVHAGKQVWGKEGWGKDYDTEEACRRIEEHGRAVVEYIKHQPGNCLGAYVPDVGDLFHAIDGQTQSGTYLHQDTRGKKVYEMTFSARRNALDTIRQVVPWMEILESEGNHDHQWHYNFYHALEMCYLNDDDVKVRRNESRKVFFPLGNTIHFFDHGKGVAKLGTPNSENKVRITVEKRVPNHILSAAERVYYWCGHLHYREYTESGKYYIERLPSIAESDEYEEDLRVETPPGAVIYRLNTDGHVDGTKHIYY